MPARENLQVAQLRGRGSLEERRVSDAKDEGGGEGGRQREEPRVGSRRTNVRAYSLASRDSTCCQTLCCLSSGHRWSHRPEGDRLSLALSLHSELKPWSAQSSKTSTYSVSLWRSLSFPLIPLCEVTTNPPPHLRGPALLWSISATAGRAKGAILTDTLDSCREAQSRGRAHPRKVQRSHPRPSTLPLIPLSHTRSLTANDGQVICEKADKSDIPTIDKKKYLVPADLTVGQVRSSLSLLPVGAFVN